MFLARSLVYLFFMVFVVLSYDYMSIFMYLCTVCPLMYFYCHYKVSLRQNDTKIKFSEVR